jgi:hypothetical protein
MNFFRRLFGYPPVEYAWVDCGDGDAVYCPVIRIDGVVIANPYGVSWRIVGQSYVKRVIEPARPVEAK